MSRDWTPKELRYFQQKFNLPNMTENLVLNINGEEMPAYSEEQKEMGRRYPTLNMFGFDMLNECLKNGVYHSEEGRSLMQQVEDYFCEKEINKKLAEKVQLWYEGKLCPGTYMDNNNLALADYLKSLLDKA